MLSYTGINGHVQNQLDKQNSEISAIGAMLDYVAMMTDVEIPTEEQEHE